MLVGSPLKCHIVNGLFCVGHSTLQYDYCAGSSNARSDLKIVEFTLNADSEVLSLHEDLIYFT